MIKRFSGCYMCVCVQPHPSDPLEEGGWRAAGPSSWRQYGRKSPPSLRRPVRGRGCVRVRGRQLQRQRLAQNAPVCGGWESHDLFTETHLSTEQDRGLFWKIEFMSEIWSHTVCLHVCVCVCLRSSWMGGKDQQLGERHRRRLHHVLSDHRETQTPRALPEERTNGTAVISSDWCCVHVISLWVFLDSQSFRSVVISVKTPEIIQISKMHL